MLVFRGFKSAAHLVGGLEKISGEIKVACRLSLVINVSLYELLSLGMTGLLNRKCHLGALLIILSGKATLLDFVVKWHLWLLSLDIWIINIRVQLMRVVKCDGNQPTITCRVSSSQKK